MRLKAVNLYFVNFTPILKKRGKKNPRLHPTFLPVTAFMIFKPIQPVIFFFFYLFYHLINFTKLIDSVSQEVHETVTKRRTPRAEPGEGPWVQRPGASPWRQRAAGSSKGVQMSRSRRCPWKDTGQARREAAKPQAGSWIRGGERQAERLERDFPGGPVVKNPPHNAEDAGWIPSWETEIQHASEQLRPCAETTEAQTPQLGSANATPKDPTCCNQAPKQPKK